MAATVTWLRGIGGMARREVMVMAQEIAGIGGKVSVGNGIMEVTGVGRYDDDKNRVLNGYGFSRIEDVECEHW